MCKLTEWHKSWINASLCKCFVVQNWLNCSRFKSQRYSVTAEWLVCLPLQDIKMVVHTAKYPKLSKRCLPHSLLCLSKLFYLEHLAKRFFAVYKTPTVYLFWVLNCAKEAFFSFVFHPGFIPSPEKSLGSCSKKTFFFLLFFTLWYTNIKSKRREFVSLSFWIRVLLQLERVLSPWNCIRHPHLSFLSSSVLLYRQKNKK